MKEREFGKINEQIIMKTHWKLTSIIEIRTMTSI